MKVWLPFQVFPEHTAAKTRYTRSLYYVALPATDRPSLPLKSFQLEFTLMSISFGVTVILTRLAVDHFTSSGLDALGQKLGTLNMARATDISR